MSPRTETSYKAVRPGKVAQHIEAHGSGRAVDDGVVQLAFAFLSGEIWPIGPPVTPEARRLATAAVLGQKSAEVIVGAESAVPSPAAGHEPRPDRGSLTAPKDRTLGIDRTGTAHPGVDADRLSPFDGVLL